MPDGKMSDNEYNWLAMRAKGGFGATSTCAAGVQPNHAALYGTLGIFDDMHIDPVRRIAHEMKRHGNIALMQICHNGLRADPRVTGSEPTGPYSDPEWGGRAISTKEIKQLIEDFILAAKRAEMAGFDGVEVHGAHGTMLAQFLNPVRNLRDDGYGGSLAARSKIIDEILDGIRARCKPGFIVGLRLSSERFDMQLADIRELAERYMTTNKVDFLDMSLWSVFKDPSEEKYKGRPLISWFTDLKRGKALLAASGKITTGAAAKACLDAGVDIVVIGRGAIIHHDFPNRVAADPNFVCSALPLSPEYLKSEGVSEPFIEYLRRWDGFVAGAPEGMYTDEADMVDGSKLAHCIATEVAGPYLGRGSSEEHAKAVRVALNNQGTEV